jgi:hypothetical protein
MAPLPTIWSLQAQGLLVSRPVKSHWQPANESTVSGITKEIVRR